MSRNPYEILGISKTADAEEVRLAYRKLALKWHPDKNLDCIDEATERFKAIQHAYGVLCDPVARAGLDDEGNEVPPEADGGPKRNNDFMGLVNLSPFFSPGCYTDFSDDPDGFYAIYADVFAKIDAEEIRLMEFDLEKSRPAAPLFGVSGSPDTDVKCFYAYWEGFSSKMTFAWVDDYDPAEAPNRAVRRAIEKENGKKRDASRKRRSEQVRSLVSLVKSVDKRAVRMAIQAKVAADAKARAVAEAQQKRERDKIDARRRRKEAMEAMAASGEYDDNGDRDYYRADDDPDFGRGKPGRGDDAPDTDEEEAVVWRCEACSKTFKSAKQLENHEKSRKHLDIVAKLRKMFIEEDAAYDTDGASLNSEGDMTEEAAASTVASEAAVVKDVGDALEPCVPTVPTVPSPAETSSDSDSNVVDVTTVAPGGPAADGSPAAAAPAQKVSAKAKREARKAKKAEKAATAPLVQGPGPMSDLECGVCNEVFASRNKLFSHVKKTGHAVPVTAIPSSKKSEGKKADRPNARASRGV